MIDSYEAQQLISKHRADSLVIGTMTTNFEWPQISDKPELDLPLSGSMGKASSLGLGLALAVPDRKVIVLDADGSLLMNLGSLVTIANMSPHNLIHYVFINEVYRTTGGQPIPLARKLDFAGLARAAGYNHVHEFSFIDELENSIENIMEQTGPIFICLEVPPATKRPPYPLTLTRNVINQFKDTLQQQMRS